MKRGGKLERVGATCSGSRVGLPFREGDPPSSKPSRATTGAAAGNFDSHGSFFRWILRQLQVAPPAGPQVDKPDKATPAAPRGAASRHVRSSTWTSGMSGHSLLAMSAAISAVVICCVPVRMSTNSTARGPSGGRARVCLQTFAWWRQSSQTLAVSERMDPSAVEHSVPQAGQNAVAEICEGVNITKPSDALVTETSAQKVEKVSTSTTTTVSGSGDGVAATHGDLSLERCNGVSQMDVYGSRDASHGTDLHGHDAKAESGLSAEMNDRTEEFREVSEFVGRNANSEVGKELHATRPDVAQRLVLSGNVENLNPRLPEEPQGQVVKADQNGTQPLLTPVPASDSVSNSVGLAAARDTSSIPGISMLANQSLPPAVFKHEEVVASKEVFVEALNKFHTVLGTRLTKKGRGGRERAAEVKTFEESIAGIPKVGGNDLDLHLLYVEVTSRGGLEQVIKDRKWKEVTNCFKFAETTTSASYILRKYYVGLLYYFEQAYLLGKTGPLIPPPISMPGPSPLGVKRSDSAVGIAFTEGQPGFKRSRKRKILPIQAMPAMDPASSVGLTVRSTIEGKFEHGYLVSVTVGTEKMRGVLYHVPPMQRAPQHATIPNYEATIGAEPVVVRGEPSLRGIKKRKRRRADDMPKKDPNAPRPNRTGYNFFFAEQRARLKALHPEKDKELSRMIGDAWNSLTEEQKTPYQDRGVQDKERYKIELHKYLELLKSQNGAIPTELAAERAGEDAKAKLKEAVVDAAIDVAVDVAVNNAVDVSIDDVVADVTTKSVTTDAPVGNHDDVPAASNVAADDVTGKAVTDGTTDDGSAALDATINGSYNPGAAVNVEIELEVGKGIANSTVAPVAAPVGNMNLLAAMDVEDGIIPNVASAAPDGSVNLLATMDFDIEPQQQPEAAPHQQPDMCQHAL